jgi:hypothetical protein
MRGGALAHITSAVPCRGTKLHRRLVVPCKAAGTLQMCRGFLLLLIPPPPQTHTHTHTHTHAHTTTPPQQPHVAGSNILAASASNFAIKLYNKRTLSLESQLVGHGGRVRRRSFVGSRFGSRYDGGARVLFIAAHCAPTRRPLEVLPASIGCWHFQPPYGITPLTTTLI